MSDDDRPLTSMDIVLRMEQTLEAAVAKKAVPISLLSSALVGGVVGASAALIVTLIN
jgi:hypothetical protein